MEDSSAGEFSNVRVSELGHPKGRGLVALRTLQPGEIIFEERPLVACQFLWNQAWGYSACDFCLHPLETAEENARRLTGNSSLNLPYSHLCSTRKEEHVDCAGCEVTYCSKTCRDNAWTQYHQSLCIGNVQSQEGEQHPLEVLQGAWRQMHLPPETASIMLVARIIATVKQAQDKAGARHLFSQFCHRFINPDEALRHRLLGPEFKAQLEQLRELLSKTLYDEYLKDWFTPQGFQSLIVMVGTNGQGIGTSALSAWMRNCDGLEIPQDDRAKLEEFIENLHGTIHHRESSINLNNEGSGLYPLQSSCNHSCVPNAEATFPYNDFTLVMECLTVIKPGEEVLVCYLNDSIKNRSTQTRNKVLRENYLFTCTCQKCQANTDEGSESSTSSEMEEHQN